VNFDIVADYFEQIEGVSSRLEITRILADLLRSATPEEASILCNFSQGQLNPPHIGSQFNLAEKSVIKAVALLTGTSVHGIEQQVKKVGDIGLVVASYQTRANAYTARYSVVQRTVQQVYDALQELEVVSGAGSQEKKQDILVNILASVSPLSGKYIVRIILDTLRLGFSDMTLIDALSWMYAGDKSLRTVIEHAYNICADLGFIALLLKQKGIEALERMHIQVGIPIRPASAERLPSAAAIINKLGESVAQPKLDGFRVQIHLDKRDQKAEIHFFSRSLQDISYMFPDLKDAIISLPATTCIIEGEVICYDADSGTFLPFQETAKRKRKHDIEQIARDLPLKLFIFDLLYQDGTSFLSRTHAQRRSALKKLCASHESSVLQVIDQITVSTTKELNDYFLEMVAAGLEGVMVKRSDAPYQAGKRNFNWIKYKRQESGSLEDTIDCVIMGYYAGSGKRASFGIGAFLVGIFNPERDVFETIAKIGTGLKDAGWRDLKKQCDMLVTERKPRNSVCSKNLTPDVWVYPEIVCCVRADEITLSPVHTAGKTEHKLGYALRFPRIMGYREDKSAQEATTVEEIDRLYEDQFK